MAPKKSMEMTNNGLQSYGHIIGLAILVLVLSVVITYTTRSLQEKFIPTADYLTPGNIKNTNKTMAKHIVEDEQDAYKKLFEQRIPTFMDNKCSPECCQNSTRLSCSRGCICLSEKEKKMMRYH